MTRPAGPSPITATTATTLTTTITASTMSDPTVLHFLCAGAAQGLVKALQQPLLDATGSRLEGRFGAVGAMREALLAGEPCDLFIVTDRMIGELCGDGTLVQASRAALGRVRTGVAVQAGAARPDVSTPEGLAAALKAATAIHFPDPVRATAGIHFANVMRELGLFDDLAPRFRTHPNGATAMREMGATAERGHIGCTQITEINYSPGVDLVGALPARFELATVYSAAVSARALQPDLARRFISLLAGEDSRALREAGGFEF
jgi:molybdate transport system substrate-binding protein